MRIRRVRCDEGKPACDRCLSTGRKCDGYAKAVAQPSGESEPPRRPEPRKQLGLPLPRHDPRALRSFEFFLRVTAPSFAGVFDVDLWLREIPRACHADAALWHAVVSLGAIHEHYSRAATCQEGRRPPLFALQEFNTAIGHLIPPHAHPGPIPERWRALIASVIFTCVCSIQGMHNQALIHLSASRRLLLGLREEKNQALPAQSPVSLASLHTIITSLDTQARALENGGLKDEHALLVDSETYNAWRFYHAPPPSWAEPSDPGSSRPSSSGCRRCRALRLATPVNLARAGQAVESLFNHMIVWTQQHASDSAALVTGKSGPSQLSELIASQKPYSRAFCELSTMISRLRPATEDQDCPCPVTTKGGLPDSRAKRKAISTLCLFQATCQLLFLEDPGVESDTDPGSPRKPLDPESHFAYIVDLAESILTDENSNNHSSGVNSRDKSNGHPPGFVPESFTPSSSTTQPLSIVAHSSSSLPLRLRAVDLLRRYPRREGLWDSLFAARACELMLAREEAAVAAAPRDCILILEKAHDMQVEFLAEREARVVLRSWREWMAGEAGEETIIKY